jgi:hypothetical protein
MKKIKYIMGYPFEEGIRTAFLFVSFGGARARQQQQ